MSWNDLNNKWKEYFIDVLHRTAELSRDEDTKVAAMVIDTDNKVIVSVGYNDLPRGVKHTKERNSRPLKYVYTSHAEISCLTNALRLNSSVLGHTMLVTLGCCPSCCSGIINSGIKEVVTPTLDYNHGSCGELYEHSVSMLEEASVSWVFDDNLAIK